MLIDEVLSYTQFVVDGSAHIVVNINELHYLLEYIPHQSHCKLLQIPFQILMPEPRAQTEYGRLLGANKAREERIEIPLPARRRRAFRTGDSVQLCRLPSPATTPSSSPSSSSAVVRKNISACNDKPFDLE